MRLHDLKPAEGSHRPRKRLGRGNATGQGTTAGKGTKGEKARSGGLRSGFRGMSSRNARMAKRRGFTNPFKTTYQVVNLSQLTEFESGSTVDAEALRRAGLVRKVDAPIKILGTGDLSTSINVINMSLSSSARRKIEAAGGTVVMASDGVAEEGTGGTGSS